MTIIYGSWKEHNLSSLSTWINHSAWRYAISSIVRINSHLCKSDTQSKKKEEEKHIFVHMTRFTFRKFLLAYRRRRSHNFARVNLNVKFKRRGDCVSQTTTFRDISNDEMPTYLTISRTLRTDYSLSGIAKSHELRKTAIAAIESRVRERRSRGDLQLRHAHAITQPAYNLRRVMRQRYVGQTHTHKHTRTVHIYLPYQREPTTHQT